MQLASSLAGREVVGPDGPLPLLRLRDFPVLTTAEGALPGPDALVALYRDSLIFTWSDRFGDVFLAPLLGGAASAEDALLPGGPWLDVDPSPWQEVRLRVRPVDGSLVGVLSDDVGAVLVEARVPVEQADALVVRVGRLGGAAGEDLRGRGAG